MDLPPKTNNKLYTLKNWLLSSWFGVILTLLGVVGSIFGGGYLTGCFITSTEYNNTIMNLKLDHQKELLSEKDKGKEEALKEIEQQNKDFERLPKIYREGRSNEK